MPAAPSAGQAHLKPAPATTGPTPEQEQEQEQEQAQATSASATEGARPSDTEEATPASKPGHASVEDAADAENNTPAPAPIAAAAQTAATLDQKKSEAGTPPAPSAT